MVREIEQCTERVEELEAALAQIAEGSWNHGNRRPGMTVMEFASEALAGRREEQSQLGMEQYSLYDEI